ncbi:MAG TPA: IS110 family transposase [Dermatophilaceae bacterium]
MAPTIRGFLIDGSGFTNAKQVCSYPGMTPSNWSSGSTVDHRGLAITKEGPAVLRQAFYQAANMARALDPQLAEFYYRFMVAHGHCHTQGTVGVARKLIERT